MGIISPFIELIDEMVERPLIMNYSLQFSKKTLIYHKLRITALFHLYLIFNKYQKKILDNLK